ncbi:LA_3696 family protein [Leptospira wolffii]|uniref:LA_3696 family protein n=1 Tax=Leptospira wolffii TaxID=409998 RepID=UPI0002E6F832|nr:hypothetical protein [Leptospira wolffii]EPG64556.1 hypothetical protein LEP1GSC061_3754 [Leptospira wolffii serovar Khorat str. Khorat-H2]
MSAEMYPFPSKSLRDVLGEKGTEAFVDYIHKAREYGRQNMIELTTERYERRLAEEVGCLRGEIAEFRTDTNTGISELRAEMHAGFVGVQEEFKEVHQEFAKVHGKIGDIQASITAQTRWIVVCIFGVVPFYIALFKLLE